MTRWRGAVLLVLLILIGVPAALPFLELLHQTKSWRAWLEAERLFSLAANTISLLAGTLAVALPVGVFGAILLYRTDLPFRRFLRFLTVLTLFVPLPLFTSAWQATLGAGGLVPLRFWNAVTSAGPGSISPEVVWKPWAEGLGAAVWIHAVAAVPWVIVLVGQGLCWVEREMEEDALTMVGPWRMLRLVTLLRCRSAIVAAGLWVTLLTVTEITVSDMMQVRTFAEEVYTQFVLGDDAALARAEAVSLPMIVLCWIAVMAALRRWQQTLPPLEALDSTPLLIPLGKARWPCLLGLLAVLAILLGVPVSSLIWKTGLAGTPPAWSAEVAASHLGTVLHVRSGLLVQSLLLAVLAGSVGAGLALVVCWLAVGSRWFRLAVLSAMAVVWAIPGPIVGLGLKSTIAKAIDLIPWYPLQVALYYGPSPVPAVWADVIRFFPCAVAIVWLVVRILPRELHDAARVDGASPGRELWHIVVPLALPACLRAGLAVGVLSLGELAASKLVDTPGSQTFSHVVFTQMHYGVTNDLAALCLWLLLLVVLGGTFLNLLAGTRNPDRR